MADKIIACLLCGWSRAVTEPSILLSTQDAETRECIEHKVRPL